MFIEILKNTVMPWWNKTYDEQLKEKYETICRSLIDVRKRLCGIDSLDVEVSRLVVARSLFIYVIKLKFCAASD